jgi:hypothetical protein
MTVFGFVIPGTDLYLSDPLINVNKGASLSTPGAVISSLLPFVFILGGIVMGGMLIIGGFDILTSMGSEDKLKEGSEKIKNALIGFLLLFGSYWLAQIAELLFKIPIL